MRAARSTSIRWISTRLAIDATSDAQAVLDHRWLLDLPEEPVIVPGDAVRLHQVLANLLTNAGAYTPTGTAVSVAVTVNGSSAALSVEDNGPGIPFEQQEHIFERYFRADTTPEDRAGRRSRARACHRRGRRPRPSRRRVRHEPAGPHSLHRHVAS